MNDMVSEQNQMVVQSIRVNNENLSSIKNSLIQTENLVQQTYANVLKGPKPSVNRNGEETPKSSRPRHVGVSDKNKTPSITGTANKVIGKPLSPPKPRQKFLRK